MITYPPLNLNSGEPKNCPETFKRSQFAEGLFGSTLLTSAQPFKMAVYGSLKTWAEQLNDDQAAQLLEETLNEEKKADQKLTQIAESSVNTNAAAAASARAGSRR